MRVGTSESLLFAIAVTHGNAKTEVNGQTQKSKNIELWKKFWWQHDFDNYVDEDEVDGSDEV